MDLVQLRAEEIARMNAGLERNEAQKGLTSADIKSLCDAAKAAWNVASDRARRVVFTWRGRRYVSTLSSFEMKIETMQGEPVAARYH